LRDITTECSLSNNAIQNANGRNSDLHRGQNRLGVSNDLSAMAAPLSPASSMAASLAFRLAAKANSDMAKMPLMKVRSAIK
jgi:hypothetical protein